MLLGVNLFGGKQPKIKDPLLLPEGKSQAARNCRFDNGGVEPVAVDLFNSTPTHVGTIKSIFLYQFVGKFLAWLTDVTAITAPLANDAFHRIFYTEGGKLKVTDSTKYADGGTDYPEKWLYPSPPAPPAALFAAVFTLSDFSPMNYVESMAGVVKIYTSKGTAMALNEVNPDTRLLLRGTGVVALDGKSFKFGDVWSSIPSSGFVVSGITELDTKTITSITKANPGVVISAGHKLFTGEKVTFAVVGMAELNGVTATITKIDEGAFSIGIDTTAYGVFSGGTCDLAYRTFTAGGTYAPGTVAITAITKDNPAVVTKAAHGLTTDMVLVFTDMIGMTELDDVYCKIIVIDSDTFSLFGVDSTEYGVFTSGNYQQKAAFSPVADKLLQRTSFYTETFVNSYGSEGPPAPASNLVTSYDGDTVNLGDSNVAVDATYGVVSKNIYRSNVDATGAEILQFLVNVPLATAAYADTISSSELGEILASTLWDAPVDGVEGIIALANETLAAFSGNLVLCSEPLYPHAWPYQFPTDIPVMGLGAFGTSILVLTQGTPYLITGNSPANYVMDKLGVGFGCVSKRSVVQVGGALLYAGTDGLVAMGTNSSSILTEKLVSAKQWREDFAPESLRGFFWEGKYIGFYDTGTVQGGFCFDPEAGTLVDLDFHAYAGYHDQVTGSLYLVVGANVVAFARGEELRTMELKTKRYRFDLTSFRAVKIVAVSYPVTVNITYYGLDGDGLPVTNTVTLTATSKLPFVHPDVGLVDECDITITEGLTAIYLAGDLGEFPV